MHRLPLPLVLLLCGCGLVPATPAPASSQSGLTAFNVAPIVPPGALGPAQEDQRMPDLVGGPGLSLAVWNDGRNFRFRAGDIYGTRVQDGGVLDAVGVPLVSTPDNDEEPSIAWDGTAWVLAWTRNRNLVLTERIAPDLSLSTPRTVAASAIHPRVASGRGNTLMVYRHTAGGIPEGVLLASDGGLRLLGDGGTLLQLNTPPITPYEGAIAAAWSEQAGAFYVMVPALDGLYLVKFDPSSAGPEAPIRIAGTAFPFATNYPSGADLAFAPDGTMGAAWRAQGDLFASVFSAPPVSTVDAGLLITSTAIGSPSLSWSGTRFRLALSNGSVSELRDLTATGAALVTTWASFPSEPSCTGCAPAAVDGTSVVRTSSSGTRGTDLSIEAIAEGAGAGTPSILTSSGAATHTPSAALNAAGTTALLTWSSPGDAGINRHDVAVRLLNVASGGLGNEVLLGRDLSYPRAHQWNGFWWVGALSTPPGFSEAVVYSSAVPGTAFTRQFVNGSANSNPVFAEDQLAVAMTNSNRNLFARLNASGGVDAGATGGAVPQATSWFSGLAVDALGRPLSTSVTPPGALQGVWLFTPGGGSTNPLAFNNTGDPRGADIASDGTHFTAVYTTVPGPDYALLRQDLDVENDGGVTLRGGPIVLARAPLIETPAIVFSRGQYLVTWSERGAATQPSRVHLRALKPDGGVGLEVPLELGVVGSDLGARLALGQDAGSLLTWTRLDSPGAGVPVAWMARVAVGAGQGDACQLDSECTTGHCANQRCCDSACNGGCGECSPAGECVALPFGTVCRAQGECQSTEVSCNGGELTCSLTGALADGMGCDGGQCRSGLCDLFALVDAGIPDAGAQDGGTGSPDAGPPDAGDADAGAPDAGEPDAGAADAGESTVDGGNQAPVAPRDFSHYSWSQGCGCSGPEGLPMFAALGLLLLGRRRGRFENPGATPKRSEGFR